MASRASVFEDAIGSIDGTNTVFSTSGTYVPGTLFVLLNGQLQQKDCVQELGGTSFTFAFAPEVGDTFQVRYLSVV